MEFKETEFELLSSLEQIVFKDEIQPAILAQASSAFTEFEQLRKGTGLKTDEFARAMGVTVAMVQEWESRRVKPSTTEFNLMRLMLANQQMIKQLAV